MRVGAVVLALFLVCSCGGGGSSGDLGDTGASTPADTGATTGANPNLERTREILEACALSSLDDLVDLLELLEDTLEPGAEPPDFQITSVDILRARVSWSVDIDRDGAADVTGTVRFEDAEGNPTWPFDLTDLLGGSWDLPTLLGSITDGTVVLLDFTVLRGAGTTGSLEVTVTDGLPSAVSGMVTVNGTDCVITLDFETMAILPEPGAYPEGTAHVEVLAEDGSLEGTLTLDGTSVVTLEVTIDGEETFVFEYDIETGELTGPET